MPVNLQAGTNEFSVYQRDNASVVSGVIFSAQFTLDNSCACDDCANAVPVFLGSTRVDTGCATTDGQALDALVCDMGPRGDEQIYNDCWYAFTAGVTGIHNIALVGGGNPTFDSRLAVYDSAACPADPSLVIACDDDSGPALEAEICSVNLVAGSTYLIRVGSFSASTIAEPALLQIGVGSTCGFLPWPYDECSNPQPTVLGFTPGDSTGGTTGPELPLNPQVCDVGPFGDEQLYNDVWFSFVPAASGPYDLAVVNAGNPTFDSRIAIYDGASCPADPADVIACDDDSGPGLEAAVTGVPMSAGVTYLIRVGSFQAVTNIEPFALSISLGVVSPANDECASAIPLSTFGTYAFDNRFATDDGADLTGFCDLGPFGSEQISDDVWYEYTPTVGGCTYISTFGLAGYDTRIAIYTGSICPNDPATVLACNDDEEVTAGGGLITPFEAGLDVILSAGTTYLIRIGNYPGTPGGGPASFRIETGPQAQANNASGMPQVGAPGCPPVPSFPAFCVGDGGDQAGCTDCPCNNNAAIGSGGGCANSSGSGTRLIASGSPSVTLLSGVTNDLRFGIDGAPAAAFCILNSGSGIAPGGMANPCFGLNSGVQAAAFDGLRCAITNTRRHGGRSADANGEVGVTNNPWGGEGGPPAGIAVAGGGFAVGETRFFQVINREDPFAVCGRGLNTSQAIQVTFSN